MRVSTHSLALLDFFLQLLSFRPAISDRLVFPRSHNNFVGVDTFDTLVRQYLNTSQASFVLDHDILACASHVADADPASNCVLPADDRVADERVGLQCRVAEDSAVLHLDSGSDLATFTDDDVGANLRGGVDLCRLMNDDSVTSNEGAAALDQRLNVHGLAQEVIRRLTDVHPVAGQLHLVELLLVSHCRENFALNRCRTVLNPVNHVDVKEVEASIDLVAHKSLRLLDEPLNLTVLLGDDDTVASRVLNLGYDNSALVAVMSVESNELIKRVLADDIRVEHEEQSALIIGANDALSELDRTSGAEWLILQRHSDLQAIL